MNGVRRTQILTGPSPKKLIHFACWFRALRSGILQIQIKCPEDLRILGLFSDPQNSTSKCSKSAYKVNQPFSSKYLQTAPGQKKSIHFSVPVWSIWKWNTTNWKKSQIPGDLRILVLFQNFEIPLPRVLKGMQIVSTSSS
jgi:hypothetical protein